MVNSFYLDLAWKTANPMTSLSGLILLLPIYKVHKLQMPIQQKLAVIGMFWLGALVTITGIIRLLFLTELGTSGDGPSSGFTRMIRPKSYDLYYRH